MNANGVDAGSWIATHSALAARLWIGTFGILLQAITGAQDYPKVPPGIVILATVGLIVRLGLKPGTATSGSSKTFDAAQNHT